MAEINFGGTLEKVITREEFSLEKAREVLKDKTIAVLGYGVQGPAQALNLRENGFNVIVGQRKGTESYEKAVKDLWKENLSLFEPEDAVKYADIIMNLFSDAGQISTWEMVKNGLTENKTLYFSHGFGIVFHDQTGIIPPPDVDVVLVAPKGSGTSVRRLFLEKKGINSSYAVFQDYTGNAEQTALALGIGIGSGYLFETSFKNEVVSDLTGERGILMGALAGAIEAQYNLLRSKGHSPSEAFNETVEELTQSLVPLIAENGMDWMFANTSTTAQRGALDWKNKFRDAVKPVFEELYDSVYSGNEAKIVIESNSKPDYRQNLDKELKEIGESELWSTGKEVRKLRPK
ncbi:MAG: ketol-acid reductoisomerase [Bacteroidales bacterium]|nr:ketol-acid reductoisomerase [Bacteroidales bacterium]